MPHLHFSIRKHIRDDMYKNEWIDIELSDAEYKRIKSDDGKYSKASALISSKLGENVQVMGFPSERSTQTEEKSSKRKEKPEKQEKKSSLWRPIWAIPFKLLWRLIKLIFRLFR